MSEGVGGLVMSDGDKVSEIYTTCILQILQLQGLS